MTNESERWEWYVKDIVRYYPDHGNFTCVHYDFDYYCIDCHATVIAVEKSIVQVIYGREKSFQKG